MDALSVTECTVYPILTRLHNEGYLTVRAEDSPSGPPRRYYKLTTLGRHRLSQMNAYWDELSDSIRELDTKERR
jgi:PadR family transcriptional regulator PadR